ncbi:hypothetical protein FRC09_020554 [Ceratobasidium sp. 395]|nr:hypothetical protein FRC09_020554 [Ceratobasidium sp. 395]
MANVRPLTEDEVSNGFYSCVLTALKDAKRDSVLGDTDLIGGDEKWLVIYGLSLYLMYSTKSETTLPSIDLSCPKDGDRHLDASTCPSEFRPFFIRWTSLVPRIQPLPQDYTHDLALLICQKSPIILPKELPNPLPFFPTPEQQALEDIRELSSKLNMISNAISEHGSFSPLWKGKLCAALWEEDQTSTCEQILAVITPNMSLPKIIEILVQHSCTIVTLKSDLASRSTQPSIRGEGNYIYRDVLRDGSPVAIKTSQLIDSERQLRGRKYLARIARGVYAWSKCHHPNVLPLTGLANLRDQLATVSPWMDNGDIRDYVNKQPDADRFNLCAGIACGLAYLHSVGIVHGNFKGANILVSGLGAPMLSGFDNSIPGKCTIQFPEMEAEMPDHDIRWAAPERFEDSAPSMAADVYALGMASRLSWSEVFTGEVPYYYLRGNIHVMSAVVIRKEAPQRPLEQIPLNDSEGDMLWSLMKKCWLCAPEERPTSEQVYKTMIPLTIDGTMVGGFLYGSTGFFLYI